MTRADRLQALLTGTEAWQLLIAKRVHSKYKHLRFEEVLEEVRFGFEVAACRFDPAKGVKFSTYAWWWGMKYGRQFARCEAARGWTCPREGEFFVRSSVTLKAAEEDLPTVEPVEPDDSADAFWLEVRRVLDARDADVVEALYRHGEEQVAVARRWGLTKVRVAQLRDRALAQLRNRVDLKVFRLGHEVAN